MESKKEISKYTLTFSKQNKDVQLILTEKQQQGYVLSDFICNAIREYEKKQNGSADNDNILNNNNIKIIEDLVGKKINEVLGSMFINSLSNVIINQKPFINTNNNIGVEDNYNSEEEEEKLKYNGLSKEQYELENSPIDNDLLLEED